MSTMSPLALDLPGASLAVAPKQRRRAVKKVNASWSLQAFGAPWCAPWELLGGVLDTLEADGVPVERIDVDADPQAAERHRILILPTILVLRDGTERRRILGAVSLAELRAHLDRT